MMNKQATFAVTEWEWLKLQLRIHEMNLKGSDYVSSYDMEDERSESFAWHLYFPLF